MNLAATPPIHRFFAAALLTLAATLASLNAAQITELTKISVGDQLVDFITFRNPVVVKVLIACVLLGINFGILGSFVVVRKIALVGDTLSHAVLPGVAAGFLFTLEKSPLAILVGATVAGLLGTAVVSWIQNYTKLKQDAALGMVLASFFALGICLFKMIERAASGNKSGLKDFFYGQITALGNQDILVMGSITALTCVIIFIFYHSLLVSSFDDVFARSLGFPIRLLNHLLMFLLALAVVVSLQAIGALMVSAMLITPAVTAYLLTYRLHRMLILASIIGIAAGVLGAFFSILGKGLPTGPSMALCAGFLFLGAFLFSPRHGILFRAMRRVSQTQQIARENSLKGIYHYFEKDEFAHEGIPIDDLAHASRESFEETYRRLKPLVRNGLASFSDEKRMIHFTPEGRQIASRIVRHHRLWELYLTNEANYESDHVHDDAEKIEHILPEKTALQLERELDFPEEDPHGKRIPSYRETRGKEDRSSSHSSQP